MRTRQQIEEKVTSLLSQLAIVEPQVPVSDIAEYLGITVIESALNTDVSGALIRSGNAIGIAVNSTQHAHRRRFTIAHELGHFILKHKGREDHIDWQFSILRRDGRSSEGDDVQEIEANMFAANLLMPKEFLLLDIRKSLNFNNEIDLSESLIKSLAKRYGVSETAMKFRLINLGVIPPV